MKEFGTKHVVWLNGSYAEILNPSQVLGRASLI